MPDRECPIRVDLFGRHLVEIPDSADVVFHLSLRAGAADGDVHARLAQRVPSAACHSLQVFGVPSSLHRDLGSGAVDFPQIVGRQFDRNGPDIFLQPVRLRGPGDRNNPGLLGKQPGERDLSGGRFLPFRDPGQQIDHCLIRFPSLRRKARDNVAEVGAVERGVLVDLAGEEAFAQGAERNEPDTEFFESRQQFRFRLAPPQRVFALERSDRLRLRVRAGSFARPLQKGQSALPCLPESGP